MTRNPETGAISLPEDRPGLCHLDPTRWSSFRVSAFQHLGDRKTQEDRYLIAPSVPSESLGNPAVFGIFDGTVGDFASDNAKDIVVPTLLEVARKWNITKDAADADL